MGAMVTTELGARALLIAMTSAFFSGLALDIAVPAVVMTTMALLRWAFETWTLANDTPRFEEARAL